MPLVLFALLLSIILMMPLFFFPADTAILVGLALLYLLMIVGFKIRTLVELAQASLFFLIPSVIIILAVQSKLHSKNIVFTTIYGLFEWAMTLVFSSVTLFILVSIPMIIMALVAGKRS